MARPNVLWLAASVLALSVVSAKATETPTPDSSESYVLCGRPACVLVDRNGRPTMARVFERIEPLVGDLAVFQRGEKAGIVDRRGHVILEAKQKYVVILPGARIWSADTQAGRQGLITGTLYDARGQVVELDVAEPRQADTVAPSKRSRQIEIIDTSHGQALGDGHGKAISELYTLIYPPFDARQESMLAVKGEKPNQELAQLFLDGRALAFPAGAQVGEFHDGVATLRVKSVDGSGNSVQRKGLIDEEGRTVMPAEFDDIRSAKDGLVTFAQGDRWGVADVRGRVRLAATLAWIDFEPRGGLFAASPGDRRFGVIDADGRWIVPARFREIAWIDDTLVAAREDTRDEQGRVDSRTSLYTTDGRLWPGPPMRYRPTISELGLLLAYDLAPGPGQNLIDREGRVVARGVSGGTAPELPDTTAGPYFVRRGNDYAVVAAYGGDLSTRKFHQIHRQFRRGRAVADDALLDEQGQVVATYATAAPQGAAWPDDLDARVEAAVDPCFDPDPVEPGSLPEPLRTVCADPAQHALLREAESRYMRHERGAFGLLEDIDLHRRFQAELLACGSGVCSRRLLLRRQAALRSTATSVASRATLLPVKAGKVAPSLRRQLLAAGGEGLELGGNIAWSFIDLRGDGQRQVLASTGGMRSFGVAIWSREGGRWRLQLGDQVTGVRALPSARGRWRDLVVTYDGGAAGGALSLLRRTAGRYETLQTCEMLWGQDGKESVAYLACSGDLPWPQRTPSSQP